MKKKILFFIPALSGGGAEKVLVNLVNNLDRKKFDITLLALFDGGVNKKFLDTAVNYKYVFKKTFRGYSQLLKIFSSKLLYKCFIKEEYDIAVSYLEGVTTRILSGCDNSKTKLITFFHIEIKNLKHFLFPYRNKNEFITTYKKYDATVFVSKTARDSFEKATLLKDRHYVKYNVIEGKNIIAKSEEPLDEITFNKKVINLIAIGRLVKQKNFIGLLNVYKRLINEGFKLHLYILGEGKDRKKLKTFILSNRLTDKVSLLGYHENPYKFLKKADLYVCSSLSEGFSTTVIESIIVETPIITTLCSGMQEILDNGKYGLIVKNNEDSLFNGLRELLQNEKKLKYYSKVLKERKNFFDTKKITKEIEDLFLET